MTEPQSEPSEGNMEESIAPQTDLLGDMDVWTPSIDRLASHVSTWVSLDSPGAAVIGLQRVGKTRAAQFLERTLPSMFSGTLACFHITLGDEPPKTEHAFLQRLMAQTGCRANLHRDTEVLRQRLVEHLLEMAVGAGSKRIVMIWDEAQTLRRNHYGWLITLFNELELKRMRPFFLLVGEPSLRDITTTFRIAGQHKVIGRFFSHTHEFLGIAHYELEDVLRAIDVVPEGDLCGPRRHMQKQYSEGFELSTLAAPLAKAMQVLTKRHQLTSELRLPMQYLRATVIGALVRIIRGDIHHRQLSALTMLECLQDSGFANVVMVYADSGAG